MNVCRNGNGLFLDFPIDVETGKLHSLWMGHNSMSHFPMKKEQAVYVFESEVPGKVKGRIPMMQLLLPEVETFVKIQWRQIRTPGCNLGYGHSSENIPSLPLFAH